MRFTIEYGGESHAVHVSPAGAGRYAVRIGDGEARIVDATVDGGVVHLLDGAASHTVALGARGDGQHGQHGGLDGRLTVLDAATARRRARAAGGGAGAGAGTVRSPMPGRVVQVLVAEGDAVTAGQGVVIVEAMKMENELRAEVDGVVTAVHVAADDRVDGDAELVTIEPAEAGA